MVRAVPVAVLALALALAPGALGAAPTLVSVTQSGGKVSASWTLPTGGQAWTVEVSKTSTVDADGYFLLDDVVDSQVFVDGTTSWTSTTALPAGTYYVHLSGADVRCTTCPIPQWSATRTVVVGGTPSSSGGGSTSQPPPAPVPVPVPSSGSSDSSGATPSAPQPTGSDSSSAPTVAPGYGTVGTVVARLRGSLALVSFRVCGSGAVDVTVAVTRGKASHSAVVTLPLDGGCTTYALGLTAPGGAGKASVTVGAGGATGLSKQL